MIRWLNPRSLVALACLIGLTAACFGPALRPDRQLAYRDFSDYYYPLYQKVQQEWEAGRLPLWSDQENCGAPLLGNPTAAVLYPGKLIYAVLPYPVAAKVYVVAHVLLAFVAMAWLLRSWEVSALGATLAGLTYAFGGPVLTQYCNVVFLVGAAWMPLGFACADGWIRLGRTRAIAGLAMVLALMVLGGDPEGAYLTGFFSVSYAVGRWVWGDREGRSPRVVIAGLALVTFYAILLAIELANRPAPVPVIRPENSSRWQLTTGLASLVIWGVIGVVVLARAWSRRGRPSLEGRLMGLVVGCGLGAGLSGCQLVPTLEFIGQSTRGDDSHFLDIYMQSIHPSRVVEWVWPNVFGSTFGVNRNWLIALPPTEDHNIWMNSIYLGGFTVLLAGCALGLGNRAVGRGWMVGVALVSVLAGFGDFSSPILWARAMPDGTSRFGKLEPAEPDLPRADGLLRDGDGGVYWFLSASLPGFRSFRYPGKLFIPAALAISALAGIGFDGLMAGRRRPGVILATVLLAIGLIVLLISFVQPGVILHPLEGRSESARSGFGPFEARGAFEDLRSALAHGSIVLAAFVGLCRLAPRRPQTTALISLLVVTLDLAWANHGQVGTVAQSAYEQEPRTLAAIRQSERDNPEPGPFRVFRLHSWAPKAWSQAGSPDRLEEMIRWERDTLRSKYELSLGISSTFSYGSAEVADLTPFFQAFPVTVGPNLAEQLKIPSDRPVNYYPRRGFDLWNTRYFILPTRLSWTVASRGFASLVPDTDPLYPAPFSGPEAKEQRDRWGLDQDVQVIRNRAAFPRSWVVHRVIPVGPTASLTEMGRRKLMTDLLYQADDLWQVAGVMAEDPHRVAWVEASVDKLTGLAGTRGGSEPVKVVETRDPTRVELEVRLDSPGLVVLADVDYPGWQLQIDDKPAEILRTNRAMRGAVVPAGSHRLVYTYRPASIIAGLIISGVALLAWATLISGGRMIRDGVGERANADLGWRCQLPGQDSNLEKQDQNLL